MVKVAIVGATGYTGGEIVRILIHHPEVEIVSLSAKVEEPIKFAASFPKLRGALDQMVTELDVEDVKEQADLVLLALPHRVSMEYVSPFLKAGIRVIDLSADYRFKDAEVYEKWYGVEHKTPELLKEAVYGIPELYREEIKKTKLVANPGCYPTAAILGLAPLLTKGSIEVEGINIDAKTGVSGAGRWPPGDKLSFVNCNENIKPYKVTSHQHQPEIEEILSRIAGGDVKVTFVPHLVPLDRGILSTIYADLKEKLKTTDLIEVFRDFYKEEPFVNVLKQGKMPETKNVCGTNRCDIGIEVDARIKRIVVAVAIDNLVKGAAGQAAQNMNVMCGFPEEKGLGFSGIVP